MSNLFQNRQLTTLIIGVLGAVKLVLQAFGYNIITDQEINQIADGMAALVTVVGVFLPHTKPAASSSISTGNQGSTPPVSRTTNTLESTPVILSENSGQTTSSVPSSASQTDMETSSESSVARLSTDVGDPYGNSENT